MVIKRNHIILVFLTSAYFLAATPFWSSITNGEVTLPLNKKGEMQGRASLAARNEALVVNFAKEITARSVGDRVLLPFAQSLNNVSHY